MMRGSQDMPSETGRCFSVDFSRPPWDEEVPHCPHFSTAACEGLMLNIKYYASIYSQFITDSVKTICSYL